MKICSIDPNYLTFLHGFDDKVRLEKFHTGAKTRKYIGALFTIDNLKYFAPLSSPKKKYNKMKNDIDFHKIDAGTYGVINFNNMIPVPDSAIIDIDINSEADINYKNILINQFKFLKDNKDALCAKSIKLYEIITTDIDNKNKQRILNRCCNFKLLEEKSKIYK